MHSNLDGITKEWVKRLMEGMDEDGKNSQEVPFDEFKEVFRVNTKAKKITNIHQRVTIRLNEIGPSNWHLKVGTRNNGKIVFITRSPKIPWEYERVGGNVEYLTHDHTVHNE